MQRSGAATRRFYAAFYQWTVRSGHPARRCTGAGVASKRDVRGFRVDSGKKPRDGRAKSHESHGEASTSRQSSKHRYDIAEDEPVLSTTDQPIGSLKCWSYAIRERSEDFTTIEVSVPRSVPKDEQFMRLVDTRGIRVGIPPQEDDDGRSQSSVPMLLSGRLFDLRKIWQELNLDWRLNPDWSFVEIQSARRVDFAEVDYYLPKSTWHSLKTGPAIGYFRSLSLSVKPMEDPRHGETQLVTLRGDPRLINEVTSFFSSLRDASATEIQAKYEALRERHAEHGKLERARYRKYRISEPLQHYIDRPGTLRQIKEDAGLSAIFCRPMFGGERYLQVQGDPKAMDEAKERLEREMDGPNSNAPELVELSPSEYKSPVATDFAIVQIPDIRRPVPTRNLPKSGPKACRLTHVFAHLGTTGKRASKFEYKTDCRVRGDKASLCVELVGTKETVRDAIDTLQQRTDNTCSSWDVPSGKLEVIRSGPIHDLPRYLDQKQPDRTEKPHEKARMPMQEEAWPTKGRVDFQPTWQVHPREKEIDQEAKQNLHREAPKLSVEAHSTGKPTKSRADVQSLQQSKSAVEPRAKDNEKEAKGGAQSNSPTLGDKMRASLRHLTQPVALLTATMSGRTKPNDPKHKRLRGVTVSSFCTVTLHPKPIISFNLKIPSRSWDAISASQLIRVHILAANPTGAALAHTFTLPYAEPHEPFDQLERLGARVVAKPGLGQPAAPSIEWRGAVLASFKAKLLPKKCIQVGDHMVALAEVREVEVLDETVDPNADALAYGMREYRRLGEQVKPREVEEKKAKPVQAAPANEQQTLARTTDASVSIDTKTSGPKPTDAEPVHSREVKDTVDLYKQFDKEVPDVMDTELPSESTTPPAKRAEQASKSIHDLGPSSSFLDEQAVEQELSETKESNGAKSFTSQIAADSPILSEALNAARGAWDESWSASKEAQTEKAPREPIPEKKMENSPNSANSEGRSTYFKTSASTPWGVQPPTTPSTRSFSTHPQTKTRRLYSTKPPPAHPPLPTRLLKTTVADYIAQRPFHHKNYKALFRTSIRAARLEETLSSNTPLTPAETAALTQELATRRRFISRELAVRNAHDLKSMLDQGTVHLERAQWLESQLEAGQVALLEEARLLRVELLEERIGVKEFDAGKGRLMGDYEVVEAQLMRLRDLEEEDEFVDEGEGEGEGDWGLEGERGGENRP